MSLIVQLLQIYQARQNHSYFPYAAGLLQAYAQSQASDPGRFTFLPIRFERIPVAEHYKQIQLADVFGFSVYVWNVEYSLALAREIKAHKPQAQIIFGGPQVPDRCEDFLRAHPEVDICVHGEGEAVFLQLLESLPNKDFGQIPGISYFDSQGQFQTHAKGPRQQDLEQYPSPYLSGVFDHLFQLYPDFNWAVLWETNRGCPFSCTFCDWGSATAAKVYRFELQRLKDEMEWFGRRKIEVVNCCDANFGILPRDLEITDYLLDVRARTGFPHIFFSHGTKNSPERSYQIQQKIYAAGLMDRVTFALQSVTPQTLEFIRRDNISLEAFQKMQQRFQSDGINTYSDMLVGLPGETYDSFVEGIDRVIREGQHHMIQFFNVYPLPNAELNQPEYIARHGIEKVTVPYYETFYPLQIEVPEYQEILIATKTLDRADWRRARVFAWWTEILYFYPKVLQIPLLLIHTLTGLSYRQLFEFYMAYDNPAAPMTTELRRFLDNKALAIQAGETEYCAVTTVKTPYWANVKEFVTTGLAYPAMQQAFYQEQLTVLSQLLQHYGKRLPEGVLQESISLSLGLYHALSQQRGNRFKLHFNFWEVSQALLTGQPWQLQQGLYEYIVEWDNTPHLKVKLLNLAPAQTVAC